LSGFTIGRLSEEAGVHIETIRYYERIGLIPKPPRSAGGRRLYDTPAAERLRFIRRARDLGFPLDDVRSMLGLGAGPMNCGEIFEIAARHRMDVRRRISDLRRLERRLHEMMKACSRDAVPNCALFEALTGDHPDQRRSG